MPAVVFGIEHFLYMGITAAVAAAALLLGKKYLKSDKAKVLFMKVLAACLLVAIVANRLSQVFRYGLVRWEQIIPDSYCGMTSLVLALAVLFGKKDNNCLHFVWLLGIFGGISTVIYPAFIGQGPTVFYLPTISGLLHHSFALVTVCALFLFDQIHVTYKKWYCTFFGFTAYLTVGAFEMNVFGFSDAFHIAEPMLDGTPLTAWFIAPIYAAAYGAILLAFELVRKYKSRARAAG